MIYTLRQISNIEILIHSSSSLPLIFHSITLFPISFKIAVYLLLLHFYFWCIDFLFVSSVSIFFSLLWRYLGMICSLDLCISVSDTLHPSLNWSIGIVKGGNWKICVCLCVKVGAVVLTVASQPALCFVDVLPQSTSQRRMSVWWNVKGLGKNFIILFYGHICCLWWFIILFQ